MSSCDARQVRNLCEADRGRASLTGDCDNCKISSATSGSASSSHAFARCLITARRRGQPHCVGHHAPNFQTWRIDKRVRHLVRPEKSEREQTHRLALPDARHGTLRAGRNAFSDQLYAVAPSLGADFVRARWLRLGVRTPDRWKHFLVDPLHIPPIGRMNPHFTRSSPGPRGSDKSRRSGRGR